MKTEFQNAKTITEITAHYATPRGLQRTKVFTSVSAYLRWERSVEAKGYDISCLDIERKPVEMKTVTNLMSGQDIQIPADTPWCCNPASETYWSM